MGEIQDKEIVKVSSTRNHDFNKKGMQDLEDQRVDKESRVVNNRIQISRSHKDHHYPIARLVERSILVKCNITKFSAVLCCILSK